MVASGEARERKGGETRRHRRLKKLGLDWLRNAGCRAAAKEVRLPLSAYRADVAGYRALGKMGALGETFALECKQSRADFLRDSGVEKAATREREALVAEVESLRTLLGMHLPDCRQGVSLFREYDEYDFGELRHERWRRLVARLALLERRLAEGVKFSRIARYASANYCYLVVEDGVLLDDRECPVGWGLLAREGAELVMRKAAVKLQSPAAARLALLERIASKGVPVTTKRDSSLPADDA